MFKRSEGFTLIELLVVIAIIGILSGIAFVSIQNARLSAFDTQIQSEMTQIRSAAEDYYYSRGGEYSGLTSDARWTDMKDKIPPCSEGISGTTGYQINVEAQNWASYAALCADTEEFGKTIWYCVDSDGNAGKYESQNDPSAYSCDAMFDSEFSPSTP